MSDPDPREEHHIEPTRPRLRVRSRLPRALALCPYARPAGAGQGAPAARRRDTGCRWAR